MSPNLIKTEELDTAAKQLMWRRPATLPGRPQTSGIAERAVRQVSNGTRTLLRSSGWPGRWWSRAAINYCIVHNANGHSGSNFVDSTIGPVGGRAVKSLSSCARRLRWMPGFGFGRVGWSNFDHPENPDPCLDPCPRLLRRSQALWSGYSWVHGEAVVVPMWSLPWTTQRWRPGVAPTVWHRAWSR